MVRGLAVLVGSACAAAACGEPGGFSARGVRVTFDGDGFADGDSVIALGPAGRVGIAGVRATPDGGLVLFGHAGLSEGIDAQDGRELDVFVRLASDGRPDPSFGDGGVAVLDDRLGVRDVLVRPDGRLVVLGSRELSLGVQAAAIWQLDGAGAPDPAFAGGDAAIVDVSDLAGEPATTYVVGAALAPDGAVVVVGWPGPQLPALVGGMFAARVTAAGDVDARLLVTATQNGHDDLWSGVTVDAQGAPRVYGEASIGGGRCMAGQLTAGLELDPTFGGGDYAKIAPVDSDCGGQVVRLPDGRVAVTGWARGLAVFDAAGELDAGFGGDGQIALDDAVHDVAGLADGAMLVQLQPVLAQAPFAPVYAVRVRADGSLDPAFGRSVGRGELAAGVAVTTAGAAYAVERELDTGVVHVRALALP